MGWWIKSLYRKWLEITKHPSIYKWLALWFQVYIQDPTVPTLFPLLVPFSDEPKLLVPEMVFWAAKNSQPTFFHITKKKQHGSSRLPKHKSPSFLKITIKNNKRWSNIWIIVTFCFWVDSFSFSKVQRTFPNGWTGSQASNHAFQGEGRRSFSRK